MNRISGDSASISEFEKPSDIEKLIADTELLDPKSPDAMFEGMTERSLYAGLRGRFRRRRAGTS